jgi:uncharacterized spore protein YtfJ
VLRKIPGLRTEEGISEHRKFHNEKLTRLLLTNYCLGDQVKEVEMEDGSTLVELINVYILFGTPEGKY